MMMMPKSLSSKLALILVALTASLLFILYHVHSRASHFDIIDSRGASGDLPPEQQQYHHGRQTLEEKELVVVEAEEIEEEEFQGPMNILLFYADDWRHDTLGAAGNAVVKTPVLDALAQEGVRFTHNCVTTSICWISRATLYSGQYLARHHFEMLGRGRTLRINDTDVGMGWEGLQNETIYSLIKQKAGYAVGHAGKLGLWVGMDNDLNWDFFVDEDGWHERKIGGRNWHITEKNTADALRFLIDRNKTKPFFLNVAYFATHAVDGDKRQYLPQNRSMSMYENDTIPIPATATQEAWERMPPFFGENNEGRTRWTWRYDTPEKHQSMMKNYYRMATEVDTSVGMILNHLEQEGQLNNTLIIFTTDNGNFHAEHGTLSPEKFFFPFIHDYSFCIIACFDAGLADKWYPHQER
jgi:arylsulfatase